MHDPGFDERAVFLAAAAMQPDDRGAFLDGACPEGRARDRIERLLRHHDAAPTLGAGEEPERGSAVAVPLSQVAEFRIVRMLGEGGMGVVYLAEDRILSRPVALKLLADRHTETPEAIERFYREARAAAGLNAPGIVRIYRFGEEDGRHFIAME